MQTKNKSLLASLVRYISHPIYNVPQNQDKNLKKFWDMFRLFCLATLLSFFIGMILSEALLRKEYDTSQHALVDLVIKEKYLFLLFMGSIWAPVVEEFTFRMGMKYSPRKLGFSLILLILVLLNLSLGLIFEPAAAEESEVIEGFSRAFVADRLFYIFIVILGGLSLSLLFKKKFDSQKMQKRYARHFIWIFYGMTLFFAFVHLFNYTNFKELWVLAPILVAPQFVIGLVLGYVRMHYGLKWAMIYHALHNSFFMMLMLLFIYLVASDNLLKAIENQDEAAINEFIQAHPSIGVWIFLVGGVIIYGLAHLIWELASQHKKIKT